MASSFEKSVKGATKTKAAPPKPKYIEHLLVATHSGEHGIAEVFRALSLRLREPTWTVVLKGLITVHFMIRDGSENSTLSYLSKHQNMLAVNSFSDAQLQGRNIRHYANYLTERARAYRDTKTDWVRDRSNRLESLNVDKGLLRETESVQRQLTALLKCDLMDNEPENDITICIFRLLVADLLKLFQALNLGMINILGHFFEMAKSDADRAMEIYRTFTRQTDYVVQYLSVARQYEHLTRITVPKLKHAPVTLGRQLDDYLKDPDFEVHRRQFLLEKENKKKGGKLMEKDFPEPSTSSKPAASTSISQPSTQAASQAAKGPDTNLIDLFDSLDDNQTTVVIQANQPQMTSSPWGNPAPAPAPFQQMQPTMMFNQNTGLMPQVTAAQGMSPFQQQNTSMGMFSPQQQQQQQPQGLQPQPTAAGFGGFTPQPQMSSFSPGLLGAIPQNTAVSSFQPNPGLTAPQAAPMQQPMATGTNPFRQSMMINQQTGVTTNSTSPTDVNLNRQSTNPFARHQQQQQQQMQQPQQQPAPLMPAVTGTNPFAKGFAGAGQRPATSGSAGPSLVPQATGTNPFRQGAFVNHQTGMGWQHNQAPIGGGLDNLETMPVFPRPAQQTPWQG
ncbi:hypothetical protein MKZ38_004191 [Zalerion maritima]|uniref:ENTH domain-containing protein n=1 Tax=Zalerion maritima TaxID=339359 RepID=A0AAD5RLN2_9PEZI|nr:hypothetical protein MKZ38_004191 [Zalerion maritima]